MKSMRKNYDVNIHQEYVKIGLELEQLKIEEIACKFEVNSAAITAICNLTDDDICLIRQLMKEKERLLNLRQELRFRLK